MGRRARAGLVDACGPRRSTGLGGAGQVVADHLERAIEALTPEQRDIAARLFDHLVTPSGTKIAHEASDLAQFAGASEGEVRPVLAVLANHRILRTDEAGRWEIFHDVLAGAVLGWKTRHEAERAVARARRRRRADATGASASSHSARSSALRWRPRSRCSRSRSAARRAIRRGSRRAASSSRARSPRMTPIRSSARARAGGRPGRPDGARRGRASSTCDARAHRAVSTSGHPVVGWISIRRGPRARRRRRRSRRASLRPCDRRLRWSRRVDGAGAAFTNGRAVVSCSSTTVARDARRERRARNVGEPVPLALPGRVERLVPSPDGSVGDRPRRQAPRAACRAGDRGVQSAASSTAAPSPTPRTRRRGASSRALGVIWARLWDTATWRRSGALLGHNGQVLVVAFDPAATAVATAARIRRRASGVRRTGGSSTPLRAHGPVNDVTFGPGGIVVTASGDGTARTWRRGRNGRSQELRGHEGRSSEAEFAFARRVVTAGADGTVRIVGSGHQRRARPGAGATAPSLRRRARRRRRPASASADGDRDPSPAAAARECCSRPHGRRQHRLVQPGRRACSSPRAVITTSSSGTSRAARGVHRFDEAQSASVAGRTVQPRRSVARHRRSEIGAPLDRRRRTRR